MGLWFSPILSTIADSSSCGMTWRTSRSIWATIWVVSSMRVPGWVRTCKVIWPESTAGKKSSPRNGTSTIDTATAPRNPNTKMRRRVIASAKRLR